MTRVAYGLGIVALISLLAAPATAQTPPASQPAPATQPAAPATQPADEVAVWVNGEAVMMSYLERRLAERTPKRVRDNPGMATMVAQYRGELLEVIIDETLLRQKADRDGISYSDKEWADFMDLELEVYLAQNGTTREELEVRLLREKGMTLKEFRAERVGNQELRGFMRRKKMMKEKFPDSLRVTDQEVRQRYDEKVERWYTIPAEARASHILISTRDLSDEDKAVAKQKAETILKQLRESGADFKALANRHSSCGSKRWGGSLGYFQQRTRSVADAIKEAAFKMQPGEFALVQTGNGYHVIKVTGRRDERVLPYDDLKLAIGLKIEDEKAHSEMKMLAAEMRQSVEIKYSETMDPAKLEALPKPPEFKPGGQPSP